MKYDRLSPVLSDEAEAIIERYSRRLAIDPRYSLLRPEVMLSIQERHRLFRTYFSEILGWENFNDKKLFEVGCGTGHNLLDFLRLGFIPENLMGVDLLKDSISIARESLPIKIKLLEGDAVLMSPPPKSQDIVYQSTVFSSILSDDYQKILADRMWELLKPGGSILWYDLAFDNPSNPDVRGINLKRIHRLFPYGEIWVKRLNLAPPISRKFCKLSPSFYGILNALPFLRSHLLCGVIKNE